MTGRILLCGLNGTGKSTLGRALAELLGRPFLDIENYWFPERQDGDAYETSRAPEEVFHALHADLVRYPDCILASVKGNVGEENRHLFTAAIWLHAPKEIRMQRIMDRSYAKFGDRMRAGGELYETEQRFFDMTASRSEEEVGAGLRRLNVPVIHADGTLPVAENAERLARGLKQVEPFGV